LRREIKLKKKNPILAAILGFILGPIGFIYIGWRYMIMGLLIFIIFAITMALVDFPIPSWMKYIILLVTAWKAWTIVTLWNTLIDCNEEMIHNLHRFPFAAMAMSDLLVGIAMFYAGAITLYAGVISLYRGHIISGLLLIFIATPLFIWLANLIFSLIAMAIDAIFAHEMENIFRSS
jgi:MFS family permease